VHLDLSNIPEVSSLLWLSNTTSPNYYTVFSANLSIAIDTTTTLSLNMQGLSFESLFITYTRPNINAHVIPSSPLLGCQLLFRHRPRISLRDTSNKVMTEDGINIGIVRRNKSKCRRAFRAQSEDARSRSPSTIFPIEGLIEAKLLRP
jgi:hypothetical protein